MKIRAKTLLALPAVAIATTLAFAGTAFAWHVTSTCGNGSWIVGLPDESWADGTVATFDFDVNVTGGEVYLTRGQTTVAPAVATFLFVTYSNTPEQTALYRPEGCVAVAVATTTTVDPTTTTLAPTTTMSSVAVVTLDTPPPAALQAVDLPPVPQPQGVLSAAGGGQTLPATGGGSSLLLAGGIAVAAGAVAMLVARRRVA